MHSMLSWWLWLKLCAWGWFTDNWCLFVSLEVQRACYLHTSPISAVDSNSAWVRTCRRFGRKKKTGPPLLNTSKRLFFHDWQRVSLALKTWVCSCSETCGLWFAVPSYFADWILFCFFDLLKPIEISIGNTLCWDLYEFKQQKHYT